MGPSELKNLILFVEVTNLFQGIIFEYLKATFVVNYKKYSYIQLNKMQSKNTSRQLYTLRLMLTVFQTGLVRRKIRKGSQNIGSVRRQIYVQGSLTKFPEIAVHVAVHVAFSNLCYDFSITRK